MTTNKNPRGGESGGFMNTSQTTDASNSTAILPRVKAAVGRWFWLAEYDCEELRFLYAGKRQYWRQAGICVVLALLRIARWRDA